MRRLVAAGALRYTGVIALSGNFRVTLVVGYSWFKGYGCVFIKGCAFAYEGCVGMFFKGCVHAHTGGG